MDRVHAGEVALATRVWPGGEPTIVGIHGLTANHTCWYPVRAPDGLLRDDDCVMTQEEAEAMAHAIPDCRLVVISKTNHDTILLGDNAVALDAIRAHLKN